MEPSYIRLGGVSYEEDILWRRGEAHIGRYILRWEFATLEDTMVQKWNIRINLFYKI